MLRVAAGVLLVAGTVGAWASTGHADTGGYSATARADSVGVQLIAKDAPVVSIGGGEVAFITPASAQAQLDSLAGSSAYASAPFPGDLIVSAPALASGAAGVPVPAFPFYVHTSHPTTPHAEQRAGPYGITADSDADASTSDASIGLSTSPPHVAAVVTHASVVRSPDTGVVTATASADIAPLAVPPDVHIGETKATVTVRFDPSHPEAGATKSTSLSIGTITVAGTEVALTSKGLIAGGDTVVPIDVASVSAALTNAGIELQYVPGSETATSITSAGLRIGFTQDLPNLGMTTVRMVLGQVSASASADALPPATTADLAEPSAAAGDAIEATPPLGDLHEPNVPLDPPRAPTFAASQQVANRVRLPKLAYFYPALIAGAAAALASSRTLARDRLRRTLGT